MSEFLQGGQILGLLALCCVLLPAAYYAKQLLTPAPVPADKEPILRAEYQKDLLLRSAPVPADREPILRAEYAKDLLFRKEHEEVFRGRLDQLDQRVSDMEKATQARFDDVLSKLGDLRATIAELIGTLKARLQGEPE